VCHALELEMGRAAFAQVLRICAVGVLLVVLGIAGAFAQQVGTCTTWTVTWQGGAWLSAFDGGGADEVCAKAATVVAANNHQHSCTATEYSFTQVVAGTAPGVAKGTRNGCSMPAGSKVDLSVAQAMNLLAWGLLVLLAGIGYIGGRQR
jgi:hypothetical protein